MRTIFTTLGIAGLALAPLQAQVPPVPPPPAAAPVPPVPPASLGVLVSLSSLAPLASLAPLGMLAPVESLAPLGMLAPLESLAPLGMLAPLESLAPLGSLASLGALASLDALPWHDHAMLPPEGWAQEDPADSLWRAAREAVNRSNWSDAATTYRRIRTDPRFARSTYRAQSFYWEAYARDRIGTTSERRAALAILGELRSAYPRYESMDLVGGLESSLNASLGAAGDARAAARTQQSAARAASQCPDQETRAMALEALMHMPPANAMPILQSVMGRREECSAPLRERATHLLSRIRTPEAETLLIEAAKSDPSAQVRQQAIFWLANVDSDRAVGAIEAVLRGGSADRSMLEAAAHALSRHRSPRATQLLRDIATRAEAPKEARMAAIHWLGQRDDAEAATFLRNLFGNVTDTGLKEQVLFALSRQKGVGNEEFLVGIVMNDREPTSVRQTALHWAGQTGALSVARLGQLYSGTGTKQMKEQIIFALSRRSEPDALDRLIDIARNEADVDLRKTAVFWIGKSNDPRAARFIAELIG